MDSESLGCRVGVTACGFVELKLHTCIVKVACFVELELLGCGVSVAVCGVRVV